ncbi:MAG: extracellular solute-binding protein [Clostridiales bacterium]|nr:extracellular solute-binding protein [Clostridiales bacterium]
MKREKIISAGLSAVFLLGTLSGLAGCSKKNDGKTISKDSPWYDVTKIEYEKPDTEESQYSYFSEPFYNNGSVEVSFSYYTNEGQETYFLKYDENGKIVEQEKVEDMLKDSVPSGAQVTYCDFSTMFKSKDVTYALVEVGYELKNDWDSKMMILNTSTRKCEEIDWLGDESDSVWIGYAAGLDDGSQAFYVNNYEKETENIYIIKEGKVVTNKTFDEFLGAEGVSVNSMLSAGNKLYIYCSLKGDKDSYRFIYDADSGNVTKDKMSTGMVFSLADDGNEYNVAMSGVYLSTDTSEDKEPVINFDHCNINRMDCWSSQVVHMTDSECVLLGSTYTAEENLLTSYKFVKAKENPNAGKKVLVVGSTSMLSNSICDAVVDFNNSSKEYFITVTDKYFNVEELIQTYNAMDESDYQDDEKMMKKENERVAKMMDTLSIDLIAGDAPDIIFDAHKFIQLKEDKYLIDLTDYVNKDLGDVEFFTNVIETNKTNGKLYSMPLTFSVDGILAKKSDVGDKKGFTFEEAKEFIEGPCNGKNPISQYATRTECFQILFGAMADSFYDENGNINLETDAFYELAKFCKENIPEKPSYDEESLGNGVYAQYTEESSPASYVSLYDLKSFWNQAYERGNKVKELYGLPSFDGRGPTISIESSIAISATSDYKDGSWEFVKSLFDVDTQYDISRDNYTNSVMVEALRKVAKKEVEESKKESELYAQYDPEYAEMFPPISSEAIDTYIETLKSCESGDIADPSIILIVNEDIGAYFADQKSIEEVTSTIQNRAQTVINERK